MAMAFHSLLHSPVRSTLLHAATVRTHPTLFLNRFATAPSNSEPRTRVSAFESASVGEIPRETTPLVDALSNRIMLVDGTSIMYRAYYKLLSKLHHGMLEHADGNGDWVLTIFTALSFLIDMLEIIPSHVAVVFDHDGEEQ